MAARDKNGQELLNLVYKAIDKTLPKAPFTDKQDLASEAIIKILEKNIPKKAWYSYAKKYCKRYFNKPAVILIPLERVNESLISWTPDF